MDPTHLHLLLNHVPTVGFGVGVALFALALVTRSNDLKQASLVVIVLVALVTIPTYVTGNAAQVAIEEKPDVALSLVQTHEGMAFLALVFMEITGALAWLALWAFRRTSKLSNGMAGAILALSVVTIGLMAQAAAIGGEISHAEIRAAQEPTTFVGPLARTVGDIVRDEPWAWVASETLHFIGLTLLVGVMLLINLRVLGVAKQISFKTLDRLLPWAMLGFAVNVLTGMLFVAAASGQYTASSAFYWKLLFVMLAAGNTLYFTFDRTWMLASGREAPALSKIAAASAMFLWVGVMYWGSMLPFIGTAF
jgi:uncharacterized membrane protein